MSKKLLVLFNGPPRSGKDTAAERVLSHDYQDAERSVEHIKLSAQLKDMTHGLYGIVGVKFDHFEDVKDLPNELILGLTPREAYINVAEKLLKPIHGDTIFAAKTLQEFNKSNAGIVVVSDLGFQLEYNYFRRMVPADQLLVVRVERPGTDFSKDSREYVKSKSEHTYYLVNNGSIDKYHRQVDELVDYIHRLITDEAKVV